jgi:hypothetical protein
MKAVVLEVKEHSSAAMKEDGTVVRINRPCQVGEIIEVPDKVSFLSSRRAAWIMRAAAAAAALFLILGGSYVYQNVLAYSYVTMDVNPSIEYTLNRNECVIETTAINSDAKPVVEKLTKSGVSSRTINEALSSTVDILVDQGYLGKENDYMLVSVASHSDSQAQTIAKSVTDTLGSSGSASLNIDIVTASMDDRTTAKNFGISTGRYALIKEIKTTEEGISDADTGSNSGIAEADIAEYGTKSVEELMKDSGWQPGMTQSPQSSQTGSTAQSGSSRTESNTASKDAQSGGTLPQDGQTGSSTAQPGAGQAADSTANRTDNGQTDSGQTAGENPADNGQTGNGGYQTAGGTASGSNTAGNSTAEPTPGITNVPGGYSSPSDSSTAPAESTANPTDSPEKPSDSSTANPPSGFSTPTDSNTDPPGGFSGPTESIPEPTESVSEPAESTSVQTDSDASAL